MPDNYASAKVHESKKSNKPFKRSLLKEFATTLGIDIHVSHRSGEIRKHTQKKVFPKKNNFSIECLEIPTENAVILKEFKIRYELNKTPMNLNF